MEEGKELYFSHEDIIIKQNVRITSKYYKDKTKFTSHIHFRRACISNDIPAEILKENMDIACDPLTNIYNKSKNCQNYPTSLNIADVTPVYKPND